MSDKYEELIHKSAEMEERNRITHQEQTELIEKLQERVESLEAQLSNRSSPSRFTKSEEELSKVENENLKLLEKIDQLEDENKELREEMVNILVCQYNVFAAVCKIQEKIPKILKFLRKIPNILKL